MYVFVYGTLKKGKKNHHYLRNSLRAAVLRLKLPYALFDLGPYPALVPSSRLHWIQGEIYRISSQTLFYLDQLEEVPEHYQRVRIDKIWQHPFYLYIMPSCPPRAKWIRSGRW